jgi:hypothetical protein
LAIPPAQGANVRWHEEGKSISETITLPANGIARLFAEY